MPDVIISHSASGCVSINLIGIDAHELILITRLHRLIFDYSSTLFTSYFNNIIIGRIVHNLSALIDNYLSTGT